MQRILAWAMAVASTTIMSLAAPARADSCFQSEVSYGRAVIHLCVDPSGEHMTKQEVSGANGAAVARRSANAVTGGDPSGTMSIGFREEASLSLPPLLVSSRYRRRARIAEYRACEWDNGYGWASAVPRCLTRQLDDFDSVCWRNCGDWRSYEPARP